MIHLLGRFLPSPLNQAFKDAEEAAEIEHAQAIRRRWQYYHGQHPKPLKVKPGEPDDNVTVNFARVIVDKGVSFLFGQGVRVELDETMETDAEEWLDGCWRQNRFQTFLQKLALNGAIAGHAFVKIVVDPALEYPRLIVLDPATVSVTVDPNDLDRVVRYKIQYSAVDPATGKPTVFRQVIEPSNAVWKVVDQRSGMESPSWETVSETVWPYAWPPIVDCQNLPCPNEYWGISDLEDDLLRLNTSVNFLLSNLLRIIRFHAHPRTWGRGFTANQLTFGVDETIVFPSPEAELRNLEMQSDLASSIQLFRYLRESLHEIGRVPEVATGKLENAGSLSGVALQILYQPLLEKTETKRHTYGDLLVDLCRRLLEVGGFGTKVKPTLHWPELIPGDPEVEAKTLLVWSQLGVSQDTILRRLGLDPETEREKAQATSEQFGEKLLTAFESGQ